MNGNPDANLDQILDTFPRFELYKNEVFIGGSRVDASPEREAFRDHIGKVQEVQKNLAEKSQGKMNRRVFHAKSHGALLGELQLRSDRPDVSREGIFKDGAPLTYPVLARFSNGMGIVRADGLPDVRGVALKIFNVSAQDPERTMDLLMTNSPVAFGRDHAEFVEFMVANQSTLELGKFFLEHREVALALVRASALPPTGGMTTLTFWTGHAYLLGPNNAIKMKLTHSLNMAQIHGRAAEIVHLFSEPDYLSADLKERARKEIAFTLCMQLETANSDETPIENALVEWKEDVSPPIEVADLVFPPQNLTEAATELADQLAFTPWHYVEEHRPLGNLARGRLFSYLASAQGRKAKPRQSFDDFKIAWDQAVKEETKSASR